MNTATKFAAFGALALVGIAAPSANAQWLTTVFSRFQVTGNQQQALDILRSAAENVVTRLNTAGTAVQDPAVQQFMQHLGQRLQSELPTVFGGLSGLSWGQGGFGRIVAVLKDQIARSSQHAMARLGQWQSQGTEIIAHITSKMTGKLDAALDMARQVARGVIQRTAGMVGRLFTGIGQGIAQYVRTTVIVRRPGMGRPGYQQPVQQPGRGYNNNNYNNNNSNRYGR